MQRYLKVIFAGHINTHRLDAEGEKSAAAMKMSYAVPAVCCVMHRPRAPNALLHLRASITLATHHPCAPVHAQPHTCTPCTPSR